MTMRLNHRMRALALALCCGVAGVSTAIDVASAEAIAATRRESSGVGIAIRADLERDRNGHGERDGRHRGGRGDRGGERRRRDEACGASHTGVAAIGAGLACCVVGVLIPLGGATDDRWRDQDHDPNWEPHPPQAEYNAANALLVVTGVGLIAWGMTLESADHARRFSVAPGAIQDGSHDRFASGVIATLRF
ncbi:MAG: hypothetical protein U0527_05030 [Candidatus Eisenbacteria bacterium]